MKSFYKEYKDLSILPVTLAKLSWTHNYTLMEKVKDIDKRLWHAEKCLENVDNPIGVSSYKIEKYISKDILEKLPTEEELNIHINLEESNIDE